jgi:hypothetical protein
MNGERDSIDQWNRRRTYVECVRRCACAQWFWCFVLTPETYYWSSSHTECVKAPLGANKWSPGVDAPRDLACPNMLGVARERGNSK